MVCLKTASMCTFVYNRTHKSDVLFVLGLAQITC